MGGDTGVAGSNPRTLRKVAALYVGLERPFRESRSFAKSIHQKAVAKTFALCFRPQFGRHAVRSHARVTRSSEQTEVKVANL